ncbi:integrin alpha-PS1-like isoform X2 [Lineus longissimus]|uniref:integrin alpha-PS1-like isoform X2 n=1 Tax=Lineus longissimus TaxID=88925 RepID=UPI00315D98C5
MADVKNLGGLLLQIIYFSTGLLAFNLDTNIPIVKKSNSPGDYFGFSVAQHQIPSQGAVTGSVLLVGAPKSDLVGGPVRNTGVVYRCPVTTLTADCTQLRIDAEPPLDGEDKEDEWLGVTVKSQGPGKKVLACAHRYKHIGPSRTDIQFIWGLGLCYTLYNTLDEDSVHNPCSGRSVVSGHEEFGVCQAGTSGFLTDDDRILIGAPGPYNWRGAIFKNSIEDNLNADTWWYKSTLQNQKRATDLPPPVDIYSYLGYSVTAGKFLNNEMTYASGSPRANETGRVVLFTENKVPKYLKFEPQHILKGEQFGSYFGAEVLSIDVNNDGLLDLVIGAPFYHGTRVGGKIYIYMNSLPQGITDKTVPVEITSRNMNEKECMELGCEHARFGFSLANLGDLNRDGYDDLAVGAPYEGNGTVYIFNGGKDGINTEYSQRIPASSIQGPSDLKTFGYSLSGGQDMDHNGYPDLLVGAYESNHALLLRARPVVNIFSEFKTSPKMVNPKQETCAAGICFKMELCFRFTAEPKNKFAAVRPTIHYTVIAERYEGGFSFSRVMFKQAQDNEKRYQVSGTLQLFTQDRNMKKCINEEAFIDPATKDLLNPINFMITYGLEEKIPPPLIPGQPLPEINDYPTYNSKDATQMYMLDFEKNCGKDNVCRSDLEVTYSIDNLESEGPNKYVLSLGEHSEVTLRFHVKNRKEDAHAAEFHLWHPREFKYRLSTDIVCNTVENVKHYLLCNLGNPMNSGKSKDFGITFYTYSVTNSEKDLPFNFTVNTTSTDVNSNIQMSMSIRVVVRTDILIRGGSSPEQVFYGGEVKGESAIRIEKEIGSPLVHSYEVINTGPGTVPSSSVDIFWPYEVENGLDQGKHLLYLMQEPQVEGADGRCIMQEGQVNPLGIAINEQLMLKPSRYTPDNVAQSKVVTNTSSPAYTLADGKSRKKRAVVIEPVEVVGPGGKKMMVVTLDCDQRSAGYSTAKCFKFTCQIGTLLKNKRAVIRIRARLWNATFIEDYPNVDSVRILSKAQVKLDPKDNIQQEKESNDLAYALTVAYPERKEAAKEQVPLWIIIVAAIGGVLLLLLLILILWLLGFFKRKTPGEDVDDLDGPMHEVTVSKKNKYNDHSDGYN